MPFGSIALPRELAGERSFTAPGKYPLLLSGEGAGPVAHDLINHLVTRGERVVVADGSNRFNVYAIVRAARQLRRPASELLSAVRVSRAFTWQQYAVLVERQAAAEAARVNARWVVALGPLDLLADNDVKPDQAFGGARRTARALAALAARSGLGVIVSQEEKPLKTGNRTGLADELRRHCGGAVTIRRATGMVRN